MRYKYFVSYAFQNYRGPGFGWTDIDTALPIRSADDVKAVAKAIKDDSPELDNLTILNFRQFDTEG